MWHSQAAPMTAAGPRLAPPPLVFSLELALSKISLRLSHPRQCPPSRRPSQSSPTCHQRVRFPLSQRASLEVRLNHTAGAYIPAPKTPNASRAKRAKGSNNKTPGSPLKRTYSASIEQDGDNDLTPPDTSDSPNQAIASSTTSTTKKSKKRARN